MKPHAEIFQDAIFVKSSKSVSHGNCVEVARAGGFYGVRDSKNQSGPVLVFTEDEWTAFKGGVLEGEF